jgi:hypothetical protein
MRPLGRPSARCKLRRGLAEDEISQAQAPTDSAEGRKKEDDGKVGPHMQIRLRNRLRQYLAGVLKVAAPIRDGFKSRLNLAL